MIKVMIADDEPLEIEALKVILQDLKENVKVIGEAANGREAIELNKKLEPDIIIMDIRMPGIDGLKASEVIKNENKDKIIIALTAYDDFELVRKALKLGINDYVLKPVRPEELIKIISGFVNFKINDECNEIQEKHDKKPKLKKINNILRPALEYIENNYSEDISLEKMASVCNVSSSYFSKLFKKEIGVNFSAYINNYRVDKAKDLLKDTDMSVLNIALDLGFEDCGYFIKVFKKIEGVTPNIYRQKVQ